MNEKNKILITGTTKGLGQFLSENLEADYFTRESDYKDFQQRNEPYDAIIHCAFQRSERKVTNENLYNYLNSSLHLTKQIISIPHKQFFYCSTVDVYPATDDKNWTEEDIITLDTLHNLYGFIKLSCESIVTEEAKNPVIMRLGAMLGKHIKPNSLMKIALGLTDHIGLSAGSSFNYIRHEDVLVFVNKALEDRLSGCFNLTSSDNTTIGEVATKLGKQIGWGNFVYKTSSISNKKISLIVPEFQKNSLDNAVKFCADIA